jgi:hypothetical protein
LISIVPVFEIISAPPQPTPSKPSMRDVRLRRKETKDG